MNSNFMLKIAWVIIALSQAFLVWEIRNAHPPPEPEKHECPVVVSCPPCPSPSPIPKEVKAVKCTIFSYHKIQPNKTAILEKPVAGWTAAVSPDLIGWLGGRIYIEGVGVRRVNDIMKNLHRKSVDLYAGNERAAKEFGRKQSTVVFLGK